MKIKKKFRIILDVNGQATIELAVMFPIIIIIAVILVNALTFFSECSKFDRLFKQEICSLATSPSYNEELSYTKTQIDTYIEKQFDKDFLNIQTNIESNNNNFITFNATLNFYPTLFGLKLRKEIFGVPIPPLKHHQSLTIEMYKPGVLF